ncbi:DNA helicase IV [Grimontia sp. NTOU-MAR1]|uniref:DNA helicase IV n=1 Tax=Grimontia sp. NTOU-MAR1 TaxID=3111011 RepID=UPI002DBFF54D|nr:DNA helicase IV [Grimontia sp. NTOU-MAR1]WRV97938.1 DNA helicase IV [Grimontia sp. NTOU-MAR1]
MKITASHLAQWFVQGDHYSIALDETQLVFESKQMTQTVPFSIWDGQCRVSRGLVWGRLTFIVSPADQPAQKITVYGLPWNQVYEFAEALSEHYQAWLGKQQNRFMLVEPELVALRDELRDFSGFLRFEDLKAWQVKAQEVFERCGVLPQVMATANPALYQSLYGWLQNGEAQRNARNTAWRDEELARWSTWFDGVESSPLNDSQRQAVLMDDNHNLLLAGAGSGKTSVLMARAQYLVASQQTEPSRILMLAFGKKASEEMAERLAKAGLKGVETSTFHAFALKAIKEISGQDANIAPMATDEESKHSWMTLWLAENFAQPAVEKRWLKHLAQWSIPGLSAERPLVEQAHEAKLQRWLWRLVDLLAQQSQSATAIKASIKGDEKAESELALVQPVLKGYLAALKEQKAYDFNSLIKEATKLLSKKSEAFGARYDHIMVDEYQDISPARLALLEALCGGKRNRAPSLFAVGDDWQAIYRFAGSDVSLTTGFLSRFSSGVIRYLDTTYRFNSQIGAVANTFIQVDPQQLSKPLESAREQKKKAVHLVPSDSAGAVLAKLAKSAGDKPTSLLLIGRNNANSPETLSQWEEDYPNFSIKYVTAHGSKGLEADYSFVLAMDDGTFPAKSSGEGLESSLLSAQDEMEHSEERRLFYVALTRARHECWVFSDPEKPSIFAKELWQGSYPVTSKLSKKVLQAV